MLFHTPEDEDCQHLWNFGELLPDYTALQAIKHPSSRLVQGTEPDDWSHPFSI
jgi:hypothetical protein